MSMARTGLTGRSLTRSRSGCPPSIGCASGSSRSGWMLLWPANRPPKATQTRRRAGSPSRGHRVQPGAGGARVLDAASAGGQAGRTGACGVHRARNSVANTEKNDLKPWLKEQWVIPSEANAECVCAMEDTLEVYQRPYDAQRPLVCFDEGPKQLVKEVRTPLPAAPGRPERIDYEYERNGTGNLDR